MLISLWAIPDAPTAYLMEHFYSQLKQGQDKATSLRRAMLDTMQNYPSPGNWAAFILLGETAVASDSRAVTEDAQPLSTEQMLASAFNFPLPDKISNLSDDPGPKFEGEVSVSSISYRTPLTLPELSDFYEHELMNRGLKQIARDVGATFFSLVYRGPWGDREVVVQGFDASNTLSANPRTVSPRFEPRRDDDAEFSPAVNEKRAGISIPPKATGVRVSNKFDLSAGVSDIEFLSTMTPEALLDFYRPLFLKIGFAEYAVDEDKRNEEKTWEFRGLVKDRALFLHVEKSFSHPERRKVNIRFGGPSK